MTERQVVVYLSNAIDERVKAERAITTDSPAATNKVLALVSAMRGAGMRCIVLSLGRGRQTGSGIRHAVMLRRLEHGAAIYAAFWQLPLVTHLVSFVSLAWLLAKLIWRHPSLSVLAYNRSFHYLPALLLARLLGVRVYLDLEDGYNVENKGKLRHFKNALTRRVFNWLCPDGAMVASTALRAQLSHPFPLICYGVAKSEIAPRQNWLAPRLQILFSGTLLEEVGSNLLLATLEILRKQHPALTEQLHFVVTGKGPCAEVFRAFAALEPAWLTFGEALSRARYLEVLRDSHVGLSLRLSTFEMGSTTFPSKVIEYAEHGLLVVSTRASDVPLLFDNKALYLEDETALALATMLATLPQRRDELLETAIRGRMWVLSNCSTKAVGLEIRNLVTHERSH